MSDDMTIKLSSETIETLKKLYNIHPNLKMVKGEKTLRSMAQDKSLLVIAPITEEIPRDFHIYDLREFLSVVSIIDNADLDFSDEKSLVVTSEDGKQKLRYVETDPNFVTSYTEKEPPVDAEVTLTVPESKFAQVFKAAGTMSLENVGFESDGETVTLKAFNNNNGDENDTNFFTVEVGTCDKEFKLFYKLDQNKKVGVFLGEGDLTFHISKKKLAKVETESGKTFYSSFNPKSSFGS